MRTITQRLVRLLDLQYPGQIIPAVVGLRRRPGRLAHLASSAAGFVAAWRVLHEMGAVSAGRQEIALNRIQKERAKLLVAVGELVAGDWE